MQIRLFVYGSLKRGEYNWHVLRDGVVDCEPARLQGAMYLRGDGYPALLLTPGLPLGTSDCARDLAGGWVAPPAGDGDWVEGELLTLRSGAFWLHRLDEFEGYFPLGAAGYARGLRGDAERPRKSEYLRVLAPVLLASGKWESVWTYTATGTPPPEWPRIPFWSRALAKELLP